jgi:hypothetical protein
MNVQRLCGILLLCWACILPAHAAGDPLDKLVFNVRAYGATGDGVTDDTIAIQRCFDEAHKKSREFNYGGSWQSMYNEIVFPQGTYRLSNMLRVSNAMIVRGEGEVVLQQTNPACGIIDNHWALRMLFQNLTFEGGHRQLHLFTANSAGAHIVIRDCIFRNGGEFAISCVMRRPDHLGESFGFYKQTKIGDGQYQYAFVSDQGQPLSFNSTVLRVDRCRFERCMKVIQTNADMGTVSNCYIETHPEMQGAAIIAAGVTKLENIEGLANVTPGLQQRWIDHICNGLICRNLKLTTAQPDTGMCAIYAHIKWRNTAAGNAQHYLVLEDSEVQCAGSEENAIVYCQEVPNTIAIRDCRDTSKRPVRAIGVARDFGEDYFKGISADGLKYLADARNSSNVIADLPPAMRPFADAPLAPAFTTLMRRAGALPVDDVTMAKAVKTRLNVADFGAVNDGKTDATPAFREAVAAAAKLPGPELLLPSGHYLLTGTIDLPAEISIRAVGSAYIEGKGENLTGFRVERGRRIAFHNLMFGQWQTAIDITAPKDEEARVLIDRCIFADISGMTVRCGTPGMPVAENNKLYLRITDSAFYYNCHQLFETNAVQAIFDSSWAVTDPRLNDEACIVNKGNLLCRDICGNPVCDKNTRDMRWIDNYHRVITDCFRFGGEAGGICLVNQRPADLNNQPFILVQNGWLYALGNAQRKRAAIYLEQVPAFVALQTNTGCNGGLQRMIALEETAKASAKLRNEAGQPWFLTSGNTIPVNDPYKD